MTYWQDRLFKAQEAIAAKTTNQVDRQMRKYYKTTMNRIIADFEDTYNKYLLSVGEGREPTPADLYNMDKYWQMQGQIKAELQKLGDRKIKLLSKAFEENWFDTYYSIVLPQIGHLEERSFSTIDNSLVQQMINQIWVADGKTWSQRVWKDADLLAETLNEQLINCVTTGKKTSQLKTMLQERFGVSYGRALTLVRTEVAHIQTEAAKTRYHDYGIQYVEVLTAHGGKTEPCEQCKALEGKQFPIDGMMPLPVHPNERCCVVPVVA